MQAKLSIVLPCYNEAESIPSILRRFREVLADRRDVEVLLVNNGSTDNTADVLAAELARPENSFARTALVEINRGYGLGIMTGIRAASGEVLSWTHADMQTDPADVLLGFDKFAAAPDPAGTFLKGRRINRGIFDAFFTFGMSVISSLALGRKLSDVNAQPKMFHRSFLGHMKNPPDDFSLDLYVLYLARSLGFIVLEQPVSFAGRRHGVAKGGGTLKGKIRLVARTWKYIFKLRSELKLSTGR